MICAMMVGMVYQGKVVIEAKKGEKLDIPDDISIEDKVLESWL